MNLKFSPTKEDKVCFGNLFPNSELMLLLKDQGIFAVGTLHQDRLRGCKLPTEKEMKKLSRGTIHQFTEKMVLFFVSGLITVESSPFPISLVRILFPMKSHMMVRRKRWCRFHALYGFMGWGGTDKACFHYIEQNCGVGNGIPPTVFHLVSLTFINSFTVYRQNGGKGSLLDFQIEMCRCLLKADSYDSIENPRRFQRSLKAKQILDKVHNDRVNHWPIKCDKPNQCKQADCTKRSRFNCSKCQIYLCVSTCCSFL